MLFDLGGVLIDVDFDRVLRAWAPRSRLSLPQLRVAFGPDAAYRRHERGEISAADYFQHLRALLQIDADDGFMAQGWNDIFVGEIPAALALVAAARLHLPCHALSNTNATHMAAWCTRYPAVAQACEQVFVSHRIGLRKPEPAAFAHVTSALGVPPGAVLFFDDAPENVQGARAAGLQAVQVRSQADIHQALCAAGLPL